MTARIGAAEARPAITLRQVGAVALVGALLLWIAVVAGRGALLALQSVGVPVSGEPQPNVATPQMVGASLLVYLTCLLAALITRRFRATATLPITYGMGGIVVLAGALGTGSVGPLALVLTLTTLAWMLGDVILNHLPSPPEAPVVRLPMAIALGLGLIGLLLFLLATLRVLNAATVVGSACAIVVLLVLDRKRLTADLVRLRGWRPVTPTWFETIVTGLVVGLVAFALLAAFVPENQSDAIRQHLPIAREIWQTGSTAEIPPIGASWSHMQAHLLYAVGYGLGGMTAAKLIQAMVGLTAIIAIAGLGWLCAGRVAATVGTGVFATIPLALWTLGHTYPDLFAVLFTVTAALCILLWQRHGLLVWLIVGGALAGFGFAAKLSMGLLIVALGAAIFLVGRRPWQLRERFLTVVVFALGTLVVLPWLMRTYSITGTLPGLSILGDFITSSSPGIGVPGDPITPNSEVPSNLRNVGVGQSFVDLVLSPWQLTFYGGPPRYDIIKNGEIGVVLLMVLPLPLLGPRTRAVAILAVTAAVSYVGWPFTFQVTRHLLPTLAIAAALCGVGVASIVAAGASGQRRMLTTAAQVGVIAGLVAVPFFFLPNETTRLPVDLILGKETAAEYVAREIPLASLLTTASATLPPDTPVGYIGLWEGAQLYTEARLIYLGFYSEDDRYLIDNQLGTTPEEVLASLHRLGIDYLIWDRVVTRPEDWRSTLLSTEFLRDHARILVGDPTPLRSGYLFEILPGEGETWGEKGLSNLLDDPDLKKVRKTGGPWTTGSGVKAKRGIVSLRPGTSIAQRVSAIGESPYLLVAMGKCASPTDRAVLALRWFDDHGVQLSIALESVIPGSEASEQFLWHRAPDQATSVSVELAVVRGLEAQCEFDEVALYRLS